MRSLELTGEIKKSEFATKVVLISVDESVRQDVLDAGANIFLKKPAGIKAIMESIGSLPG